MFEKKMSIKVDDDEYLDMYHYEEGHETATAPKGVITDKNGNVICHTSVYTYEYNVTDTPHDVDWNKAIVLTAEEGTLIRVFHYNKWYVSTHKKLDSNMSRWGCKYSFRTLFNYALEDSLKSTELDTEFFDKLDKTKVYTFLLRNNSSNRIVCNSPSGPEPKIYFTGMTNKGNVDMSKIPVSSMEGWNLPIKSVERHYPQSREEFMEIENSLDYTKVQGLVVFTNDVVFKVMCEKYLNMRKIRDNCPNMIFRYAQLRQIDPEMCSTLVSMFPTYSMDFSQFENTLYKAAYYISVQYINRYVKNKYASVTPLQYKITKKLREWYVSDPVNNRVTPDLTLDFINKENYIYIYKLVVDYDQVNH
jgi:hypothetical protein